jgi:hypothetical protein
MLNKTNNSDFDNYKNLFKQREFKQWKLNNFYIDKVLEIKKKNRNKFSIMLWTEIFK